MNNGYPYPPQQQGENPQQTSYPPQGFPQQYPPQGYPPQQMTQGYQQPGYQQQTGYYYPPQQQTGYAQQPYQQLYQPYPPQGTYAQQPYQQNPYAAQQMPYQQQMQGQPYQQPYDPMAYGQFQQSTQPNAPYHVQPAQENKRRRNKIISGDKVDGYLRLALLLMMPVILALFIWGMLPAGPIAVKWICVVLSLAAFGCLAARPLLPGNGRLTGCILLILLGGVMTVNTVATMIKADQTPDDTNQTQMQQSGNMPSLGAGQSAIPVDPYTVAPVIVTPAPTEDPLHGECVQRMESFMYYWSNNNIDQMVSFCSPSWIKQQSDSRVSLFSIKANRTPVEWTATSISGTENDNNRTITTTVSLHRNTGEKSEKYVFKVMMTKEDGVWYVDPRSLESNEQIATATANMEVTQPPTPAPVADNSVELYYNPTGGTRYHLDRYCKSTADMYLPFKGVFTYGELNNDPYDELVACPICAAPIRPKKN